MRNNASRDEYVPQHSSRYETKGTSSRGLADARVRGAKIAAIGMLTLAVIILGIAVKTHALERTVRSDASTVQLIPFRPSRWWITRLLPWRIRALPRSRMP